MGLISKTVWINVGTNPKYYEELGYEIPKRKDFRGRISVPKGTKIEVRVEDLKVNSHTIVEYKCDNCGGDFPCTYQNYNKNKKEDGKIYCRECARKLYGEENARKTKLKNGKSFYDWCIENNRKDVLNRWDYDLNGCSPKDILFGTSEKYWFKCNKHKQHKSELKQISNFTSGQGSIECKQCNSIAQYILDNFPNKELYDIWDKEKNGDLDPWEISYGSNKKCWFICQEKNYHGSYEMICTNFSQGQRCCYCKGTKIHKLDSFGQQIVNKYGEEFLWRVWSIKNTISPFDILPKSNRMIWINCLENDYHGDYEVVCSSFTMGKRCPYCDGKKVHPLDSIGQYIIDNYGEEFLWKVWSDKNDKSPFEYSVGSGRECWWNCPDGRHEPFKRSVVGSRICEFRCPICLVLKSGDNNVNWNPNLTDEERINRSSRYNKEYRTFIKEIYKRDYWTCQCCGYKGKNLNAHHLNGYDWDIEHRTDINNGITLCEDCHKLFHHIYGYGKNKKEQFEEFLKTFKNKKEDNN